MVEAHKPENTWGEKNAGDIHIRPSRHRSAAELKDNRPNRLKEERLRSRLSQREVGLLVGINSVTVTRHEQGQRLLSADIVEKYAQVYKIPTWQIFLDPNDPAAPVTAPTTEEDSDTSEDVAVG